MQKIVLCVLVVCVTSLGWADETSFRRVEVPDSKGRQIKAVLTFDDAHKSVEVQPVKGNAISIPYGDIDRCAYEFTQRHRVNEGTIATAPTGVGVVMMFTKSKSHWLEIYYHDTERPHSYVLRMDKHNYLRILDALKAHTGIDAEILGNAKKR